MDYPSLTDGYAAPGNGWWPYAKYPELHRGRVAGYCPSLGNTADRLWDFSGNSKHGTMMPTFATGPTWEVSDGKYVLSCDGVNDYVISSVALPPSMRTLSMWTLWDNPGSGFDILLDQFISTGTIFYFNCSNSRLYYYEQGADGWQEWYCSFPDDGKWHHVAVTHDFTTTVAPMLFIDGLSQAVTISIASGPNGAFTGTSLGIGARVSGIFHPYRGKIDDTQIYNRALSQNEITQLYQLGRGGSYAIDYEMMMAEPIAAGGPFPHFIRRSQQLSGGLVAC